MSLFFSSKEKAVKQTLQAIPLPEAEGLSVLDALVDLTIEKAHISLRLLFGYPIRTFEERLRDSIKQALAADFESVDVEMDWKAAQTQSLSAHAPVDGVKNIVAVASGKGGVGKSTIAANIALALAHAGARVGVLDADIYGPSQSLMLGVEGVKPEVLEGNRIKPISALNGVQMIGMGNLVNENTPMIWRGPMVSGAFKQLLNTTAWDEVDYLIVDMPPGTGDIQLTLSQSVPVSGSVIVTTPQNIALMDARKGIEMFRKVSIPIFGVVENMSTHICSQCGHEDAVFGNKSGNKSSNNSGNKSSNNSGVKGGERLSEEYGVEVLGRLPLQASICEQTDAGKPPVAEDPSSAVSQKYLSIALKVSSKLWVQEREGSSAPVISISDD